MPPDAAPLRVLMILESNYTSRGGGAESQVRTLARELIERGVLVTVVTPRFPWGPQVTAERHGRVPVGRVPYPIVKGLGAAILHLRFAAFLVGRRRRYDVWHVHIAHHLGIVTCVVGALLRKRVVVKFSGWWEFEEGVLALRGLGGALVRRALGRAAVLQAISTRMARELEAHGLPGDAIEVLPNAVDAARFDGRATPRGGATFTAVFVGRLVPEKELGVLLEAWARAFAGRDGVRLWLVGEGKLADELRAQAERLGIAAQVELLGHRDRVEEVVAAADLGVLPSRVEGLSNTLLETMAAGLPVIATRVSGSEDFVVTGRNGWLVPVGDVAAIAAALTEAAALPAEALRALGRNAREDVVARAAIDAVVPRLLALYRGA